MSLYLKYRPKTLKELRGNEDIKLAVASMMEKPETCPHVFLLTGPTGCGKTTTARIMATMLGCSEQDCKEIDSADFRGIDTVREIRNSMKYHPLQGSCRVWIIDECHKMTNDAQSAALKMLEDTPSHVYFILCTSDPQKLLPTIKGRCVQFQVKPLNDEQMIGLLSRICRAEKTKVDEEVLRQITLDSLGHSRNAIQILEQVIRVPQEKQLEIARKTAEEQSQVIELCRALIQRMSWKKVAVILTGLKDQEPENIRRVVLGYCQAILLKGENDGAAAVLEAFWEPTYNIGFPGIVFMCYQTIKG